MELIPVFFFIFAFSITKKSGLNSNFTIVLSLKQTQVVLRTPPIDEKDQFNLAKGSAEHGRNLSRFYSSWKREPPRIRHDTDVCDGA